MTTEEKIKHILKTKGPCLSSEVVQKLVASGLKPAAARQAVKRSKTAKKLRGFRFPNKESFVFLNEEEQTERYFVNLEHRLEEKGTSYARALAGLKARDGVALQSWFGIASGAPIEPTRGHITNEYVLRKLTEIGLVKARPSTQGDLICYKDNNGFGKRRNSTCLVENILIGMVRTWLSKIGWCSYNTVQIRTEHVPKVGQFQWDLTAPCYLHGIRNYSKGRVINGHIVADILLDREVSLQDIRPFLSKCDALVNQKRPTRLQPMFVADRFKPDALKELRARGYFIAIPGTIFGEEIAERLKQLIQTLSNAAEALKDNPDSVFQKVNWLNKLEGAAGNLRGILFELMVAHTYQLYGFQFKIREQIRSSHGELAEIDILATRANVETICIECKGKQPGNLVDVPELKDWIDKALPRIKDWLNLSSSPENRKFEFYVSTDYTKEAMQYITVEAPRHIKQPIRFFNGEDVLKRLRELKLNSLIDIFNEQFFKEQNDPKKEKHAPSQTASGTPR